MSEQISKSPETIEYDSQARAAGRGVVDAAENGFRQSYTHEKIARAKRIQAQRKIDHKYRVDQLLKVVHENHRPYRVNMGEVDKVGEQRKAEDAEAYKRRLLESPAIIIPDIEEGAVYIAPNPKLVDVSKIKKNIRKDFKAEEVSPAITPVVSLEKEEITLSQLPAIKIEVEPELANSYDFGRWIAAEVEDASKVPTEEMEVVYIRGDEPELYPVEGVGDRLREKHGKPNLHLCIREEVELKNERITAQHIIGSSAVGAAMNAHSHELAA